MISASPSTQDEVRIAYCVEGQGPALVISPYELLPSDHRQIGYVAPPSTKPPVTLDPSPPGPGLNDQSLHQTPGRFTCRFVQSTFFKVRERTFTRISGITFELTGGRRPCG